MKREDLETAGLTKEQIDTVMKMYGQDVQKKDKELEDTKTKLDASTKDLETYKTKIAEYDKQNKDNVDWKTKYEEIQAETKKQEAERKAQEEDKILTDNILTVFGDKKFTSDYAKNGLIQDIKTELAKPENKGLGIDNIFSTLTKDKQGIFVNPNQVKDMPKVGDSEENNENKEIPLIW